jgi:hypothetical protein
MPVSGIGLGGRKKAGKILGLLGIRGAKKRVGKRNRVEVVHFRIFCQSWIDEEDDRHVDAGFMHSATAVAFQRDTSEYSTPYAFGVLDPINVRHSASQPG